MSTNKLLEQMNRLFGPNDYEALSRTTAQLPTREIWERFPIQEMRLNPFRGSLLETDFRRPVTPIQMYVDAAEGIYPAATNIGELVLFGTTNNQGAELQWNIPIDVAGGPQWAMEFRIKAVNVTNSVGGWFCGLAAATGIFAGDQIADGGTIIDGGALGFQRKEADGDKVDFVYDEASQVQNEHDDDYVTPAANTYNTFGMVYDGTTIQGYLDGTATGTAISATDIAAADFPTTKILFPSIYLKNANDADFYITLDWIRVAQMPEYADLTH